MRGAALAALLCTVAAPWRAQAQPDTRVGHASDGLAGLGRVGVPRAVPWMGAFSASAGYGFTESVLELDDTHHRVAGRLAFGLAPVEFFAVGLQLDGRYDSHSVGTESDDGMVGDPRLLLRGMTDLGGAAVGAQATVWVPGENAPSIVLGALSVDLEAMADIALSPDFHLAANVGYRLDQSAKSIEMPDGLSAADRLALGLSDSDALLLGVGAGYRTGQLQVFGEWTWDLLLGDAAPAATASPMRAGLGARLWAGELDAIQLEGRVEVGLSKRPDAAAIVAGNALVPVEPRFAVHVGVTFRFPSPAAPEGAEIGPDGGGGSEGPVEGSSVLAGRVVDPEGQPVAGAQVTVVVGGTTYGPATTGADGAFSVDGVAAGSATVSASAEGFTNGSATAQVVQGETSRAEVTLQRDLPNGQIRGVVQSFRGEPVQATVRVEPLGTEVTADADGAFEVDVAPGEYQVVITAEGYAEQTRSIRVEQQGVTILNVDLRNR